MNIKTEKRNALTPVLFAVYLLALSWLILFKLQFSVPVMGGVRVVNLVPLLGSFDAGGGLGFGEIRLNILAFIPLGIYIRMLKPAWSFAKKVLAIAGLTVVFELTQFIFAIGRADVTDLISNTLGGLIGIGVYALLFRVLKDRTNKVVNILAAIFTILALSLVAALLLSHRWVMIQ